MVKDKNARKLTFRPPKKDSELEELNPALARANFLFEHVALALMTAFACIGGIIWMVAIATDYWVISISSSIQYLIENGYDSTGSDVFLWSYSGLWRRCDVFYKSGAPPLDNITVSSIENHETRCDFHPLSKSDDDYSGTGAHPADIVRAEMSIVILVVIMMSLALGFSVYSLKFPRYTYKRLAATLHAFTAIILFVIVELVKSGEHPGYIETSKKLEPNISEDTIQVENFHGYSFLLAWTALLVFVSTAISFLCMSGKRKNLLQDSDVVLK